MLYLHFRDQVVPVRDQGIPVPLDPDLLFLAETAKQQNIIQDLYRIQMERNKSNMFAFHDFDFEDFDESKVRRNKSGEFTAKGGTRGTSRRSYQKLSHHGPDFEYWGATHEGSKAITGEAAAIAGIEGYGRAEENQSKAKRHAMQFLRDIAKSKGSREPLYHAQINSRGRKFYTGKKIKLPLSATSGEIEGYGVKEGVETIVYKFPPGTKIAGYQRNTREDIKEVGYEWAEAITGGEFEVTGIRMQADPDFPDEPKKKVVTLKQIGYFDPDKEEWKRRKTTDAGWSEEDHPRGEGGQFTSGGGGSIHKIDPSREDIKADPAYVYHGTSVENLYDIAASGKLHTHGPSYGTDQSEWPDGSREKRSYWSHDPEIVKSFYPAEGKPALVRVKRENGEFRREGGGSSDHYSRKPINTKHLEVYTGNGKWTPVSTATGDAESNYDPNEPRDPSGKWTAGGGGGKATPEAKAPAKGGSETSTGERLPKSVAEVKPVKLTKVEASERAWDGKQKDVSKLGKQVAGKLGEEIAIAYVKNELGLGDAQHMNAKKSNYPVDMIGDHQMFEVKTGQVSNSRSAQQWRATIGEPGDEESEWLKSLSKEDKAKYNAVKAEAIMERKHAEVKKRSELLGEEVHEKTLTILVDPDRQIADVYVFDGYHLRIGYNAQHAKDSYVGSFRYADTGRSEDRGRTVDGRIHAKPPRRYGQLFWENGKNVGQRVFLWR